MSSDTNLALTEDKYKSTTTEPILNKKASWKTIIEIGFIVLIIIIIIIVIIVRNRSSIDIVNNLPNYKIYYPKENMYLGILNVRPITQVSYSIDDPFWVPLLYVAPISTPDFGLWYLESVTSTSFDRILLPNQSLKKIVNTVFYYESQPYKDKNVSEYLGYANRTPCNAINGFCDGPYLNPLGTSKDSGPFIYTQLENNTFTLETADSYVSINTKNNNLLFITKDKTYDKAIFQLIPDL